MESKYEQTLAVYRTEFLDEVRDMLNEHKFECALKSARMERWHGNNGMTVEFYCLRMWMAIIKRPDNCKYEEGGITISSMSMSEMMDTEPEGYNADKWFHVFLLRVKQACTKQ